MIFCRDCRFMYDTGMIHYCRIWHEHVPTDNFNKGHNCGEYEPRHNSTTVDKGLPQLRGSQLRTSDN